MASWVAKEKHSTHELHARLAHPEKDTARIGTHDTEPKHKTALSACCLTYLVVLRHESGSGRTMKTSFFFLLFFFFKKNELANLAPAIKIIKMALRQRRVSSYHAPCSPKPPIAILVHGRPPAVIPVRGKMACTRECCGQACSYQGLERG